MWKLILLVAADTGKTQYKTGAVQNLKTLLDSDPQIRSVVQHCRTYTENGKPCTGGAWDLLIERVSVQ
jgi:hypothetical protein